MITEMIRSKSQPNKPKQHDYLAKIVIIGDSSVGKTNIMLNFVSQNHSLSHTPTIGVDFKSKIVTIQGNTKNPTKRIKLQMWDTAGQQRFRTITETYYNGASGIIIVYAINDRKSFQSVNQWLLQIAKHNKQIVPKLILGNKCDLASERKVAFEEGKMLASQNNALFMEVSAKESINIEESFMMLSKQIKRKVDEQTLMLKKQSPVDQSNNIKLDVMVNEKKKSGKECC